VIIKLQLDLQPEQASKLVSGKSCAMWRFTGTNKKHKQVRPVVWIIRWSQLQEVYSERHIEDSLIVFVE